MVGLKYLIVLVLVDRIAGSDMCSSQSSCESCYSSSFLCHWCKDTPPGTGSCHYKLSPQGCQVGDACSADDCADRNTCSSCTMGGCKWCASSQRCVSLYSWTCALPSNCLPNAECLRPEPEFIGYKRAVPDWLIGVFIACFIVISVLSVFALFHLRRVLVTSPEEMAGLVSTSRQPNRLWLFRGIAALWTVVVLCAGLLFVVISLYWPSGPEVSMCNAELMWGDTLNMIINSVTTGKTTVESEVLITVYNPNRIDLTIHSVNGNIYYRGGEVGTVDLSTVQANQGSASDGLGVISFNGFDRITEIFYDFNVKHKLLLEFELFVTFSVGPLRKMSLVTPKFVMNVNDPPPQEHCKCKDKLLLESTESSMLDFEYI